MTGAESSPTVQPGASGTLQRTVDASMATTHFPGPGVLSTPSMIGIMELACHEAVRDALPDGHTSVGFEVHVRHVAPAHVGEAVVATGKLLETNGRKLTFAVECRAGDRLLGEGTHRRAIIPLPAA